MVMTGTRDKRTQQTRLQLLNALLELLNEFDPQNITIKALTQKAGIARQTFYSNYASIEDILLDELDIFTDEVIIMIENDALEKNYSKIAETIISCYLERIDLFVAIHKIGCNAKVYNKYFEETCRIKKVLNNCNKLSEKDLLVTQFYTGGVYMLFYEWIANNRNTPITNLTVILKEALKFLATK